MMEAVIRIIHCGIGAFTTEEQTVELPEPGPAAEAPPSPEAVLDALLGTE